MATSLFLAFSFIKEILVEDMPDIWRIKGKEKRIEEEGIKRASRIKKKVGER